MYGLQIAFKDFNATIGFEGSKWVGFTHFIRLFNSYFFEDLMINTLRTSLLTLLFGFPAPIILALLINELKNVVYKKTVQTITYAPYFISSVVMVGIVILFLSPSSGIINHIITLLGYEPVAFMQKPEMFTGIYVITKIWQDSGWNAVIFFASLSSVDKELYQAAYIDGANKIQRIIHINIPAIVPTIVVLLILRCGSLMDLSYEMIYLMQNPTNLSTSEVISTYVYKAGLLNADYSFATAVGLFNSAINCVLLLIVNKITRLFKAGSLW
jgi:ABC-type polysaccharide transport system, permease component